MNGRSLPSLISSSSNRDNNKITAAVDNKVGNAVEDEEKVIHRRSTDEPDWRSEAVSACNHLVHVEHLV